MLLSSEERRRVNDYLLNDFVFSLSCHATNRKVASMGGVCGEQRVTKNSPDLARSRLLRDS
jgi:hypothetical protein